MPGKTPVFVGDYHKYDVLSRDGVDYILCEEPGNDVFVESIPLENNSIRIRGGRVVTRLVEVIPPNAE